MKTNAVSIIAILLIASLAMVSCAQPNSNPANAKDLVQVSFTKPEAKSASVTPGTVDTPELGSLWFQYKAVKNAADDSGVTIGAKSEWTDLGSSAGLAQTIELSRGKWDISLRGFASSANRASGTNPIFEGNVTYDVGADLATRGETVNVELDFTNPSGTGSYQIAVTVPQSYVDESAKVKVTVTPSSGTEQSEIKTYSSEATQTFTFSGLANGSAQVKVEYMDNTGASIGDPASANMLIMTDMTTKGVASVSETNTYTISFAGAINGTAEEATPSLELSGNAFMAKSSTGVESAAFSLVNYTENQVEVYYTTDLDASKDTILSGDSVTATLDVDTGTYVVGENYESKSPFIPQQTAYVAVIGSVSYSSLQNALDAAKEGDIIYLLKDTTELSDSLTFDKDYSITINGEVNGNPSTLQSGDKIIVTGKGSVNITRMDNGYNNGSDGNYQKVAIVITSIDGSIQSNVMYATCFNVN